MQETSIYPRTSGYLKSWMVDIGESGEGRRLLAEIDEPEVDAQLNQTKAHARTNQSHVSKPKPT